MGWFTGNPPNAAARRDRRAGDRRPAGAARCGDEPVTHSRKRGRRRSDLGRIVPAIEIACDESGAEGEKLANGETRLFTHAGVAVPTADAVACVAELRVRIGSPARMYKANHLLREKHRRTLEWFLGPDGPISGRARVVLVDKERFLLGTFLGLLANPDIPGWLAAPTPGRIPGPAPGWPAGTAPGWLAGLGSSRLGAVSSDWLTAPAPAGPIGTIGDTATNTAPDMHRRSADPTSGAGDPTFDVTHSTSDVTHSIRGTNDTTVLDVVNAADTTGGATHSTSVTAHPTFDVTHTTRTTTNTTVPDANRMAPDADSTAPDTDATVLDAVNELLRGRLGHDEFRRRVPAWPAGHDHAIRAIAARQSRRNPDRVVLDPLFWAITRIAEVWGGPVAVVHDRHLSLTPSRVAALVATGGLARFDIASAGSDARVQLADFLAGIVRRTYTTVLGGPGDGDPALLDLVRPYLATPS